jgi:4-amino-4-deoxy-L-arabinose transferase-like glycosyltransferase
VAGVKERVLVALPVLLAVAVTGVLVAVSGSYGYHRDEFYYLACGLHPALGYVDHPPLTPLIAAAEHALFGDSVRALRLAPALATGLTVLTTAMIAKELGGDRAARALAAGCVAVAAFPIATGHILSTTTFDLLAWTAVSWLVLRALRVGGRAWVPAGMVAGVGLENKALLAGLLGALGVGVLLVGPRRVFRDRWMWLGVLLAVALWMPNLIWQASHGWPQLAMAAQIAEVGNGGSQPRWLFPVFQLVLVSPLLVPVWAAGLWSLIRDPALSWARSFAVAYGVLFVGLLASGSKPYYLAALYPALLAAGATPTLRWLRGAEDRDGRRGVRLPRRVRPWALGVALGLSTVATALLMLPLVPARMLPGSPIVAVQPIAADTVGWPDVVGTIGAVYRSLPPAQRSSTVVLARNYGEAGAVDLFRRGGDDLPPAYSGHNSYADWGPPPDSATTVIAVGFDEPDLRRSFTSVRFAARMDNGIGLSNLEQGRPVWICTGLRESWAQLWPQLRYLA